MDENESKFVVLKTQLFKAIEEPGTTLGTSAALKAQMIQLVDKNA